MRALHFLGALAIGALDGAARVAIPGFYRATGDDRAELDRLAHDLDAATTDARIAMQRRDQWQTRAQNAESKAVELYEELAATDKHHHTRVEEAESRADGLVRRVRLAEERARAAEEKDAKGVKALADAIKGIGRLTAEAKSAAMELARCAEAAEMRLARDAEAQRANAAEKRATDADAARERTFETMDNVVKQRNEAWARIKSAEIHEPLGWVRFDRRGNVEAFCVAWQLGYEPVYRSSVNQAAHPLSLVESLRALAAKAEAGGFTIQASSIRKLVG